MKVQEIVDRVSRDLVDPRNVRWTRAELIDYLNDAIAAILIRRPDLSRTTANKQLTGNTLTLPDDAYQILTVNHIDNIAAQYVDINKLNQLYPDWRVTEGVPSCWTRNELDETTLFVYPKPTAEVTIEFVYSRNLAAGSETDDFPLPDLYEGVVVDFMMYRAYNKDGQNASESNKAQLHFQSFATSLGDKAAADSAKSQLIKASEGAR
ncbi:DUF6682 family protein [Photobacterium sp. OFAV2-7]|uniref:phage adaptor protein n=1 Tax=Photobacterium sp. OFAV2-7 TaxID=2917748 RepID=UPI001EF6F267|nr:DUF6682 family protein [Photobacterium sp. OFAV2-7]MCG7586745.1 hypothetical protein [Photobacterium sp. OFAV2-7]